MRELYKYTKIEYIQSIIENGIYASTLDKLNDPYEAEGILYLNRYRVICATNSPMKMLMWSYYGQHRECVVTFEPSLELKKVSYERKISNHRDMSQDEIIDNLLVKGHEWSNEKEYRYVWSEDADNDVNWKHNNTDIFLKSKIKEVRFGVNAEHNPNYISALKVLKEYNKRCENDEEIKVSRCILSTEKYGLVVDKQWDYIEELKMLCNKSKKGKYESH